MQEFIKRSTAVRFIKSGMQFTMELVTADVKRGTGGELIEVENWQVINADGNDHSPGAGSGTGGGNSRCPNHDEHETINIFNPVNKRIITVHIKLIQSFNGKRILNG